MFTSAGIDLIGARRSLRLSKPPARTSRMAEFYSCTYRCMLGLVVSLASG
jgi:hypothetical protein